MAALVNQWQTRFPRVARWLFQPRGPEAGEVLLKQRRVFIFPTRYGFFFAFSLLAFLAGSINYDLALGFVLTFFLAAAGLVAMLHTFHNQVHLVMRPLQAQPVFAGGSAVFEVVLDNRRDDERAALWLRTAYSQSVVDLAARSALVCTTTVPTARRGWLDAPRLTVDSRYPLGLFRAWSYWQPALRCLVYPTPAPAGTRFPAIPEGSGEGRNTAVGVDDFGGLRQYLITDNPRHIAWKAAANALATGAPLQTKQFLGAAAAEAIFDLADFPPACDLETRISQLTRWVLDADAASYVYTLRLGLHRVLGPAQGEPHRLACLRALALVEPLPAA